MFGIAIRLSAILNYVFCVRLGTKFHSEKSFNWLIKKIITVESISLVPQDIAQNVKFHNPSEAELFPEGEPGRQMKCPSSNWEKDFNFRQRNKKIEKEDKIFLGVKKINKGCCSVLFDSEINFWPWAIYEQNLSQYCASPYQPPLPFQVHVGLAPCVFASSFEEHLFVKPTGINCVLHSDIQKRF